MFAQPNSLMLLMIWTYLLSETVIKLMRKGWKHFYLLLIYSVDHYSSSQYRIQLNKTSKIEFSQACWNIFPIRTYFLFVWRSQTSEQIRRTWNNWLKYILVKPAMLGKLLLKALPLKHVEDYVLITAITRCNCGCGSPVAGSPARQHKLLQSEPRDIST